MAFWSKSKEEAAQIPTRIKRMTKDEIIMWMDSSLMNLHKSYDEWRFRGGSSEIIDEYLDALNLMWAELSEREKSK